MKSTPRLKYNINVNIAVLFELAPLCDYSDAAIIDYLRDYCRSSSEKIGNMRLVSQEGNEWTWINYTTLMNDMPGLHINTKPSLTVRIKKIERAGFIETKNGKGYKLYIRLTDKIDKLYYKL